MHLPEMTASKSLYRSPNRFVDAEAGPRRAIGSPAGPRIAGRPGRGAIPRGAGGGPGPQPDLHRAICAGVRTDLDTDSKNCGACGVVCPAGDRCCGGHCVPLKANCGGCGPAFACAPTQTCCPDEIGRFHCVDPLNDPANCGACGNICPYYPSAFGGLGGGCCEDGICLPDRGWPGHDFSSNPRHCGHCNVACAPGEICSEGHCCPPCHSWFPGNHSIRAGCLPCENNAFTAYLGLKLACCDGVQCIDLNNSTENCSSCGHDCRQVGQNWVSNKICKGGKCQCPSETPNQCPNLCVNLQSDAYNCGVCGRACGPNELCCNGICIDVTRDMRNCGKCGSQCGTEADLLAMYIEGQTPSHACCSGHCLDVTHDDKNCGGCGIVCPQGQHCCDGACVDFRTDEKHCGSCAGRCGVLNAFIEGVDFKCCNGVCFDLNSDSKNCGACNHACPPSWSCNGGVCSPPIQ